MDWFLYDNGLRHEMVKKILIIEISTLRFVKREVVQH